MIVKCIKESIILDDIDRKNVPEVGKIYKHVVIMNNATLSGTRNNTWYLLKETNGHLQHSSLFEIIEIDDYNRGSLLEKYANEFDSIKLLNEILK